MEHGEILAVGPRELPDSGPVEVWFDAGSGGNGQRFAVPVEDLELAERDGGEGRFALYSLRTVARVIADSTPATRSASSPNAPTARLTGSSAAPPNARCRR